MSEIKVDIWMDFGCPWSRISLAELERVASDIASPITIRFHSLRLDPDAPADYGKTTIENLCEHLSIDVARAEEMLSDVVNAGVRAGLHFDFHHARGGNSFDAHRLVWLARTDDKHVEVARAVFRAHFEEGLLISDHDVLLRIGVDVGLSHEAVESLLSSRQFVDEVLADESAAAKRGIERTPHFIINDELELSGVQYADDWRTEFAKLTK